MSPPDPEPPAFQDHFSDAAELYARYRPSYPDALFDLVADRAPARDVAWDCGTGNGQAALGLAGRFGRVVATDASAEQIARAFPHPEGRVTYRTAPAEASGLETGSVDAVLCAQSAHWFDHDRFADEVRRVVRPGGVVALATYRRCSVEPGDGPGIGEDIDGVVERYYRGASAPYWPPERRHVETGYRSIPFPFPELDAPPLHATERWPLAGLLGYLRTWSASLRLIADLGPGPLEELAAELTRAWGDDPERVRTVRWPIAVRLGRVG